MPTLLSDAYRVQTIKTQQPPPSNIRRKKKNYTMIEGFDIADGYVESNNMGTSQTVGTNGYNSDNAETIETPEYINKKQKPYSYPPNHYMERNSMSNFPPQYETKFQNEPMRTTSFKDIQMEQDKNFYPVSTEESGGSPYVRSAGYVPYLKDASGKNDVNAVMNPSYIRSREGFNNQMYSLYSRGGMGGGMYGMGCMDAVNHVMNCPMCSRYFKCDTRIYNIIIFMLILVFTIIIFFLYREEKR